jgi:hypothetical protein
MITAAKRPGAAAGRIRQVRQGHRGEATLRRMLAGATAALLPIMVAPLAAIGLWQLLIMVRPGYATLFMGDLYRPRHTLGLEEIPRFTPRPADLGRSPAHNSDIVVVGRSFKP